MSRRFQRKPEAFADVTDVARTGRCTATAVRNGFQAVCIRPDGHEGDHVSIRRTAWRGRQPHVEFAEPAMKPPVRRRRVRKDRYSSDPPEEVVSL